MEVIHLNQSITKRAGPPKSCPLVPGAPPPTSPLDMSKPTSIGTLIVTLRTARSALYSQRSCGRCYSSVRCELAGNPSSRSFVISLRASGDVSPRVRAAKLITRLTRIMRTNSN